MINLKAVTRITLSFLLLAGLLPAQSIVTVQNAASLGLGTPAKSVAPGSLVSIQIIRGGPVVVNPDLSKVSVKLRPKAGGADLDATVLQAFAGSYLALIPRTAPLGEADVILTVEGQTNFPATVQIVRSAPGIFARGSSGLGPALIQNDGPDTPPRLNLFTDPARPGDYLTIWGTGLGDAIATNVTIELAGVPVAAAYAGASPMFPGLDQINVPIPAGLPESCFLSVLVRSGDGVSNESTFAFSSTAGPCKDPFGFTAEQLKALDENKSVRLGLVSLRSEVMPDIGSVLNPVYVRNEALFGEFALRDTEGVAILAQPVHTDDHYFGCRLSSSGTFARFTLADNFDVGDKLHAEGPGQSFDAPHPSVPVVYLRVFDPKPPADPPVFGAGQWTVTAPGGATTGAFHVSRQLPPPLRWSNRDALAQVDRTADIALTWSADGYTADDILIATLTANSASVTCRAPASAGQLTLPGTLMSKLNPIPIAQLQLRLTPRPDRRTRFTLSPVSGGTEPAVLEYLFTDTLRVSLK